MSETDAMLAAVHAVNHWLKMLEAAMQRDRFDAPRRLAGAIRQFEAWAKRLRELN